MRSMPRPPSGMGSHSWIDYFADLLDAFGRHAELLFAVREGGRRRRRSCSLWRRSQLLFAGSSANSSAGRAPARPSSFSRCNGHETRCAVSRSGKRWPPGLLEFKSGFGGVVRSSQPRWSGGCARCSRSVSAVTSPLRRFEPLPVGDSRMPRSSHLWVMWQFSYSGLRCDLTSPIRWPSSPELEPAS